jgi:choline dehydrogenase-like flavoprotein
MIAFWYIVCFVVYTMAEAQSYDFVIVGGGTAGLVLANRLSANPKWTVAVIEAGGDVSADHRVLIPGLFMAAAGSEIDWAFATTPQVCDPKLQTTS